MCHWLNPLANLLAFVGIALIMIAGVARLSGHYTLLDIGAIAILQAGSSAVLIACLGKLELLLHTRKNSD